MNLAPSMEIRGSPEYRRPAIARRSCDHCRSRKIACDRSSPCSNCVVAKLECRHSAVAARKPKIAKETIGAATKYEQKVDKIAKDVEAIRALLEEKKTDAPRNARDVELKKPVHVVATSAALEKRNHSAHIVAFVQSVVNDEILTNEARDIIESLEELLARLESPITRSTSERSVESAEERPSLEALLEAVSWAKQRRDFWRIAWVARILPLEIFEGVCRRGYLADEEGSVVEDVIANGFMTHIFAEYAISTGKREHGRYHCACRREFQDGLARLPLLFPASMESVAALTLGAYDAIESSDTDSAWMMISTASTHYQRLGYHQSWRSPDPVQRSLFWSVYKLEKVLALRLGRNSALRDQDIDLPIDPDEDGLIRVARIQGQAYDELYSPEALRRPSSDRGRIGQDLASQLRLVLNGIEDELSVPSSDPMKSLYLQCILVCNSSLLVWVLRATSEGPSQECLEAAREVMELHQACMSNIRDCTVDPSFRSKYINWALMHVPFVPFSVLFMHAVQASNTADLERLERFADSLKSNDTSSSTSTHPYLVYELLCKAARLAIQKRSREGMWETQTTTNVPNMIITGDIDFSDEAFGSMHFDLGEWYAENQQLMRLLDSAAG